MSVSLELRDPGEPTVLAFGAPGLPSDPCSFAKLKGQERIGFPKVGSLLLNREHWPHRELHYTFNKRHVIKDEVQAGEQTPILGLITQPALGLE